MNVVLQNVIVGLVVALAAYSVVRRFAPVTWRRHVREAFARMASALGLGRLAEKLRHEAPPAGACGACGGCSAKQKVETAPAVIAIKPVADSRRRCSDS